MLAGKNQQPVSCAGWEFPYQRSWEVELFLPPCWECGTDIFFPATEKKKNTKKALKAFTYHCNGLYVAFCENVSFGAPEGSTPRREAKLEIQILLETKHMVDENYFIRPE